MAENESQQQSGESPDDFEVEARQASPGLLVEFKDFLLHNKKWWLTPIVVVLLFAALFVVLSGSAFAPFIYTIF